MANAVDLVVGVEHGPDCTCQRLAPVAVTAQPVIVSPDCPRQREIPASNETVGLIDVMWPDERYADRPQAADAKHLRIRDAATREEFTCVLAMQLNIGQRDWRGAATAYLKCLVDEDDLPLKSGRASVMDGDEIRTAVFRYAVAGMYLSPTDDTGW